MRLHTHSCTHIHVLMIAPPQLTLVSLQVCRKGQSEDGTGPLHTMKEEDSNNQSLSEVGALYFMSGSKYDAIGKRIRLLSHPGFPLVGLLLFATLPIGASIKQSFPRVKLSHRGKTWNIVYLPVNFIFTTYLHSLYTFIVFYDKWENPG